MGTIEQNGGKTVFRQDEGEITAWFDDCEEKMVLAHKGSLFYRWTFGLLVLVGALYLALIFFLI